jgi:hypothetical protein
VVPCYGSRSDQSLQPRSALGIRRGRNLFAAELVQWFLSRNLQPAAAGLLESDEVGRIGKEIELYAHGG